MFLLYTFDVETEPHHLFHLLHPLIVSIKLKPLIQSYIRNKASSVECINKINKLFVALLYHFTTNPNSYSDTQRLLIILN